ncbi:MAG: homoserine dehydrogenase [Firmicutes bacterium]|nr:homoserine dehydrogenase [Bacillota bacterium]
MKNGIKKHNIAIMGLGVVGGGTYDILLRQKDMICRTHGVEINVVKILDKNKNELIKKGIPKEIACDSIDDILSDKSIELVVETIGGISPAKDFILKCLNKGKSIVTANKELLAKHGAELESVAEKSGVSLYFEAAVAGGIPIIKVLEHSMQANNLQYIMGIVNGTTNYILTKMTEEGRAYGDVLKKAQELGFAEADPTSDIDGFDSVYKLSILASLAFHTAVDYTKIYREGISRITASDIENARNLGFVIKLLAIGKRVHNEKVGNALLGVPQIEVRVHPCFVPIEHPLASVRNEFNAVFLKGDSVDDIMLYGRGAGSLPTASAIVSDIIDATKQCNPPNYEVFSPKTSKTTITDNFTSSYYLALSVEDKPGALASITQVFGKTSVSISQLIQQKAKDGFANLVFLTHPSKEFSMVEAVKQIKNIKEIKSVDSLIRVLA